MKTLSQDPELAAFFAQLPPRQVPKALARRSAEREMPTFSMLALGGFAVMGFACFVLTGGGWGVWSLSGGLIVFGLSAIGYGGWKRRCAFSLLQNGRLIDATVSAIADTGQKYGYAPIVKVSLRVDAEGETRWIMVRLSSPDAVEIFEDHCDTKRPLYVLYNPQRPRWLMLPQTFALLRQA